MLKDEKILVLEETIKEFKQANLQNQENLSKMAKLFDLGVIDENGEFIQNN